MLAMGCACFVGLGVATNTLMSVYLITIIAFLLHFAVAFASRSYNGERLRTRSCVAMLCE